MLGGAGALTSLMLNVIGAPLFGKYPLELIRVYLTFPLGEQALELEGGIALAVGCCLYLATGMLFGIPFHMLLVRYTSPMPYRHRLVVGTVMGIVLWLVNFYGILSWLQPLLFGGNWIVTEVPWYVAAATHVTFGVTMALVYPLGLYKPYRLQTDT